MANPRSPSPPLKPTAGADKISRPDHHESRGGQNSKSVAAVEFTSGSSEETQAFGQRLGRALRSGDVVALYGELGSGKTTLIQGIAKGLGRAPETIKSPTFVLMREYPGEVPLVHVDGYRLKGPPAVAWLDVELILSSYTITVIEWAERFAGLLPDDHVQVHLSHVSANRRRIRLLSHDPRFQKLIQATTQKLSDSETASDATSN